MITNKKNKLRISKGGLQLCMLILMICAVWTTSHPFTTIMEILHNDHSKHLLHLVHFKLQFQFLFYLPRAGFTFGTNSQPDFIASDIFQ
jgi:hypothetical protein